MGLLALARRSHFLRHNSVFFMGAAAVGALNYLYYPILGRLLKPASFGEVQTLISLFLQITIFLSVMGLITVNIVANYRSAAQRNAVVLEFEKVGLLIAVALLALTMVFGRQLAHFLQFNSTWPFTLLVVALLTSVPFTFRSAFLRGRQKFGLASLANLLAAGSKLVFAVILVAIGWGTLGAIGGLVLAQVVAAAGAAIWAARAGLRREPTQRLVSKLNLALLAPELRYGLLVLVGSLIITLQYSIDVLVVKHYFDPHTAGLYAGVASVARIILFLTTSIALVMMSMVRLEAPARDNRKLLVKSLALTLLVGVPALAVCVVAPRLTTGILIGGNYAEVASLLPALGSALCIIAILNVFVTYYLALRCYDMMPVLLAGGVLTYALMYAHHGSLRSVVNNLLIGSTAMLAGLLAWVAGTHLRRVSWQKS